MYTIELPTGPTELPSTINEIYTKDKKSRDGGAQLDDEKESSNPYLCKT